MTSDTRKRIKRVADHALNDMERAVTNLNEIKSLYEGTHDDYAKAFEAIIFCIAQASDMLKTMIEKYI